MEFFYFKCFESVEVYDFQDFKVLLVGSYEGYFILLFLIVMVVKILICIQLLDVYVIFVGCLVVDKLFGFFLFIIVSVNFFM